MKKLETLQQHIIQSGLISTSQITLHVANLKPYLELDEQENALIMDYQVALFIKDFTGELHLLALVIELAIQEIWQAQCSQATLESIETDPLDSTGYTVAAVIKCQEGYDIAPVKANPIGTTTDPSDGNETETQADAESSGSDSNHSLLNINGIDHNITQRPPIIGTSLPYLVAVNNTETDL